MTFRLFFTLTGVLLSSASPTLYAQIPDLAEGGDSFGQVIVQGDFNGDGFADLAVGLREESVGDAAEAGMVNVLYGSKTGLETDGAQVWHQDVEGVRERAEVDDQFGVALAAGDFDGDGFDDLAVGVHQEDIPERFVTTNEQIPDAGAVQIFYGTAAGLSAARNQLWTQDTDGLDGLADDEETFGESLAAGDFDGDGFDDLAIGSPREDISGQSNAGVVNILYGSADSLTTERNHRLNQGDLSDPGQQAQGDHFGLGLAAGDFNCDGRADLAVYELEEPGGVTFAGGVSVFYGRSGGFDRFADPELWTQDAPGLKDDPELGDQFGRALAAGDFDDDGCDELAIGIRESFFGIDNGGAVQVLVGTAAGLTSENGPFLFQDGDDIEGKTEVRESFGSEVAAGDFNADGFDDLAVGIAGENIENVNNAGAVQVFYGSKTGLSVDNDEIWHRDVNGTVGEAGSADIYGASLAGGDFDRDGIEDLAVGIPGDDLCSTGAPVPGDDLCNTGAVHVIRGDKAGLTTVGNRLYRQATVIAIADDAVTPEETPVVVPVLDNDLATPGGEIVFVRATNPAVGIAEDAGGGAVRYTPPLDFVGQAAFTYTARNTATGDESTGMVAVEVLNVNDPPEIFADTPFTLEAVSGQPYQAAVGARDVDGDALSFSAPVLPAWLAFTEQSADRAVLEGTPPPEAVGVEPVTVRVTDGTASTDFAFDVTVALGAPAATTLLDPPDRAAGVALPTTLVWQAVAGAAGYDVQVSSVADFSATAVDSAGVPDTTLVAEGLDPLTTYFWRVRAVNASGVSDFTLPFLFSTATGVPVERGGVPERFALEGNYPNPFNPTTTIVYALAAPSDVRLTVYDLYGRAVRRLVEARQPAGRYSVAFSAEGLASGAYLYRLEAGSFSAVRRLVVVK